MKTTIIALFFLTLLSGTAFAVAQTPAQTPIKKPLIQSVQPASVKQLNRMVAIVNNDVITQRQLDQRVKQVQEQAEASGNPLPSRDVVAPQILQEMIAESAALQLVNLNHISVSDAALSQAIAGIAAKNHITVAQLQHTLSQQGLSFKAYSDHIKNQLLIQKLERQAIANSIIITPTEVKNYLATRAKLSGQNEAYHVAHILIPLPANPTPSNISATKAMAEKALSDIKQGTAFSKVAAEYSKAPDALRGGDLGWQTANTLPTLFVKPIESMHAGQVIGPIKSDSGFHILKLIAQRNVSEQQHFVTQYHLNQILIKISPVVSSTRAQTTLRNVAEAINNGKAFTKLAEQYSQDPLSNKNGGDAGWIELTQLSPAMRQVVSTLPLNTLSKPFKDDSGWHLVKISGKKQVDNTKAFHYQQAQNALFQQRALQAIQTWKAKIVAESYVKILIPSFKVKP